jgi:hypothetical protein
MLMHQYFIQNLSYWPELFTVFEFSGVWIELPPKSLYGIESSFSVSQGMIWMM